MPESVASVAARSSRAARAPAGAVPDVGTILYVGRTLPKLSETFVYREVLALRGLGVKVLTASVHPPEHRLGDARVDALAAEAIDVYGRGAARLWADACGEVLRGPRRCAGVFTLAARDALLSRDHRRGGRAKVFIQAFAGLALAHRVRGLGIMHIHAHMAHVPATIAMYAAGALGVPFSFTGHANDLFVNRSLLREKLERAAFVACISRWHREFYRGVADLPDARMPVVRCGVEVPRECVASASGSFRIVAVGRLIPKKGFDLLIEAVAKIRESRPAARIDCRIVGEGPERPRLQNLVRARGLERAVDLSGPMANGDVLTMLEGADLFVLPCRVDAQGDKDGIPVVLMEAMARGVPVISGDLPAIRELVRHAETGLLSPAGDAAGLASAIGTMMDDPGLRARLGSRGREWVAEEFASGVNAERLVAAFAAAGKDARPCAV